MTDREVRSRILQWLYDNRDQKGKAAISDALAIPDHVAQRVLFHLKGLGLVEGGDGSTFGSKKLLAPQISARGVDVLEGSVEPPQGIAITHNDHSTSFSIGTVAGGAVQQGSGNTQNISVHIQSLIEEIKEAPLTEEQKRGVFSKLRAFLADPATSTVVQGAGSLLQLIPNP